MAADGAAEIPLVIDETGSGCPVLVVHGGGGPATMGPITAHLSEYAHVLTATLPGWNGAPRPEQLRTASDYADAYLDHLRRQGLENVVVIGNSLGGWITAEMAARDRDGLLTGIVILDGAGIEVPEEPMIDFLTLTPRQAAEHTWHDADAFFVDPATVPAAQAETQRANMATLSAVFGDMFNPQLRAALAEVTIPALVLWGASDRIFTPGYGRAYAAALPNGRFELVSEAGHLPQLENGEQTLALIDGFLREL